MTEDPAGSSRTGATLRTLSASDAGAYRELRLRMLREHPEAFGSSFEEESALSLESFASRLTHSSSAIERLVFGWFQVDGALCASASILFDRRPKERHRAHIAALYVHPACRGQGIGQQLIQACVDAAREHPLTQIVYLKVTVGNHAARKLYLQSGFRPYGIQPNAMQIEGVPYAAELMALNV